MTPDLTILKEVIARKHLYRFAQYIMPSFTPTDFHAAYYHALDLFARGAIRRLIVTIPPQHGKSLGSSQLLPAYLLGLNPDLKIAIASYAFGLASRFNRHTQRIMEQDAYRRVFPLTALKSNSAASDNIQTSAAFEVVGHEGGIISTGRGGGLTGNRVDVVIMDDIYKNAEEGNSPVVRDSAFDWYTSVVKTRLHNDSRELIVFTRWHEDDLIGRIMGSEPVRELTDFADVDPSFKGWYRLNFEAVKESEPTAIDTRSYGAPLWPEMHSAELLASKRAIDPHTFECMYQGTPADKSGRLYDANFETYNVLPTDTVKSANYTDTADTGRDKLCSVCYRVGRDGKVYLTDVLYTSEPMELTEPATAAMLLRNDTRVSYIESNNGGRGFARAVQRNAPSVRVEWFTQTGNKESRIATNAATVLHNIVVPIDWRLRWPDFHEAVTTYKRDFKANRFDDAPDVLTGIVEREIIANATGGVRRFGRT